MEFTINEQNGVIIHRFSGEICIEDMLDSWDKLLASYTNLKDYKGILTSFLDAEVKQEDDNLNVMVDFLKGHLDQLKDLKIAIVMDTPMVANTIIIGQKMKSLQIKPFTTVKAAMYWIEH